MMEKLLNPGGLKIVDPAMADNGVLYTGFDLAFVREMAALCAEADYILPNLTEACLLTDTPYHEGLWEESEVKAVLKKLAALGAKHVILKGISYEEGRIGNAVYDCARGELPACAAEQPRDGRLLCGGLYRSHDARKERL